MSRSKKRNQKKTIQQAHRYRSDLGSHAAGFNGTLRTSNSYLSGSDEGLSNDYPNDTSIPISKKPINLVIKDWCNENMATIIISTVLIPLFIWIVMAAINNQKDIAVLQTRLQYAEEQLSEIKDDIPNKEALQITIDSIQNDLSKMHYSNIEKRLEILERSINEFISEEKEKTNS